MKDMFSSLIVWHCTNHRLEPSVGDPVESVSDINRFKMSVGMVYVLYNVSPKNLHFHGVSLHTQKKKSLQ